MTRRFVRLGLAGILALAFVLLAYGARLTALLCLREISGRPGSSALSTVARV